MGLVAFAKGDIAAARNYLARAGEAGDARAWAALAQTYDPAVLARMGVTGVPGDPQRAKDYLAKAASAGFDPAKARIADAEKKAP